MEKFRGAEISVTAAEGFVRMIGRKNAMNI
jgi:hypothetical protein